MMGISIIEAIVYIVVCIATFVVGYWLGYVNSKKKTIGQIDYFSNEHCFNTDTIYRIMGTINIFSNQYAVILEDGKRCLFATILPDYDWKKIQNVKYVRLCSDGESFWPASTEDIPRPPAEEKPNRAFPSSDLISPASK